MSCVVWAEAGTIRSVSSDGPPWYSGTNGRAGRAGTWMESCLGTLRVGSQMRQGGFHLLASGYPAV